MRLLAYGGTNYGFRSKIGNWSEIPESSLGDFYGIPESIPSFGLGIIDRKPCLIYRERQNIDARGGYPFTLLIDPGGASSQYDPWLRANWNAAALLYCLVGEGSSYRDSLLNPVRLSFSELTDILGAVAESSTLEEFAPVIPSAPAELPASDPGELWRSLLSGAPDFAGVTVANLSALHIPRRPTLEIAARWLRLAPTWVRAGGGWLVGGSDGLAEVLGSGVVLDDGVRGADANPLQVIENGRRTLRRVYELKRSHVTSDFIQAIEEANPIEQRSQLSKNLDRGEHLIATSGGGKAFQHEFANDQFAKRQQLGLIRSRVLSAEKQGEPIDIDLSRAFLNNYEVLKGKVSTEIGLSLHPTALNEYLDELDVPPNNPPDIRIPERLSLERCLEKLEILPEINSGTLMQYRGHLKSMGAGSLEEEFVRRAFETIVVNPSFDLLAWWHERRDNLLCELLEKEAARHLAERAAYPNWLRDSILFCQSEYLEERLLASAEGIDEACIGLCLRASGKPYSPPIAKWIRGLSESPLRREIGVAAKRAICGLKLDGWAPLCRLIAAMSGGAWEEAQLSENQLAILTHEFGQLLEEALLNKDAKQSAAPDLVAIDRNLHLGEPALSQITALAGIWPETWGKARAKLQVSRQTEVPKTEITRSDRPSGPDREGGSSVGDGIAPAGDFIKTLIRERAEQKIRMAVINLTRMKNEGYAFNQLDESEWNTLLEEKMANYFPPDVQARCSDEDVGIPDPERRLWRAAYGVCAFLCLVGVILVSPLLDSLWKTTSAVADYSGNEAARHTSYPDCGYGINRECDVLYPLRVGSFPRGPQDSLTKAGSPNVEPAQTGVLDRRWQALAIPFVAGIFLVLLARRIWPPADKLSISNGCFRELHEAIGILRSECPEILTANAESALSLTARGGPGKEPVALSALQFAILHFMASSATPEESISSLGEGDRAGAEAARMRRKARNILVKLGLIT